MSVKYLQVIQPLPWLACFSDGQPVWWSLHNIQSQLLLTQLKAGLSCPHPLFPSAINRGWKFSITILLLQIYLNKLVLLGFVVFLVLFWIFFSVVEIIKFLLVFGPSDLLPTESHDIFVVLLSGFPLLPMVINSPVFPLSFRQSSQLDFFFDVSSFNTWGGLSASEHLRIYFKISSLSGVLCPFRTGSQGTLSAGVLNRLKITLQESTLAVLLILLLTSQIIENYHFMISVASSHPQILCLHTADPY